MSAFKALSSSDAGTGGLRADVVLCPDSPASPYHIILFPQENLWVPGNPLYNTEPREFSSYNYLNSLIQTLQNLCILR
jgi:hypothetical protein